MEITSLEAIRLEALRFAIQVQAGAPVDSIVDAAQEFAAFLETGAKRANP